jgi:type IV pilus assembly protein PilP
MKRLRIVFSTLVVAAAMAAVFAQAPGGRPGGGTTATTATTASSATGTTATTGTGNVQEVLQEILEGPGTGEQYRYDPQGRRDPFQSLIGPAPKLAPGQRPPGPPGFLIDEIKLQGVVRTKQQGLVAMVNGPDNKGYLIRVGDKVLDGEVVRITPSSVVFRQEVNDPTRIERFREVVKDLIPEAQRK